jgi:hypothetical protein
MEVTRALSNRARAAGFAFGEDTAIVAVQHMLWQTVDLCEAIVSLGVRRENIFALGKVYSNSAVVIGTLRDRGITVLQSTIPRPGEFERCLQFDACELWRLVRHKLAGRKIKRILVLDDGGSCINTIPPELLGRYAVCGVEQTSFGIFQFEVKPPPFAVMAWARTAVKLQIGGPIFSQCLLDRFEERVLGGNTLRDKQIGIVGLGSIGGSLANLIARQHNHVSFYDPDPIKQLPSNVQGRIRRVASLEELLLNCDYVFGCSGRAPFRNERQPKYRPGIKLFSASGGDQEFGPIIDDLKTRPGFNVAYGTWDISCDGPSGPISIAYLGYPYNFVARDVEAVPISIVQLETSGLLAALIQARIHLSLYEGGRVQNSGIHRISPEAQRFVYQRWRKAMNEKRINLAEVYGYDPSLLLAACDPRWFSENSEPSIIYEPNHIVDEAMGRLVQRVLVYAAGSSGSFSRISVPFDTRESISTSPPAA